MSPVDERTLDRARDHAVAFLREIQDRHVGAQTTREELLAALRMPLSEAGEDAASVIDTLAAQASRGIIACAGPRYFGYVIGGSLPVALGADWLVSTWDQNPGIYATSPLTSVVEEIAREWLLELFDLPRDSGLGFVTGCQMASFTALCAARHHVLRKAGWNVQEDGLCGAPPIQIVTSAESHTTIDVALRYLGLGTRRVVRVDTDGQGRMRADRLRQAIKGASGPIIVCAQAGNVNTGAFDPLREIADITGEHDAWLHVDGAFGLWARASRKLCHLADGIERADSWATDAHKWLNVPYDCGVAIVRHAADHRAAMTTTAAYIERPGGSERDAVDWVPEFSRRGRGVPVYAALRHLGTRGVETLVDGCARLATQMAHALDEDPGVEILNEVVLNQVLVRFGDDDEQTRAVVAGVQDEGTCWLSGTIWHGKAAMRVSVSSWATTGEDIDKSAAAILKVWSEVAQAQAMGNGHRAGGS